MSYSNSDTVQTLTDTSGNDNDAIQSISTNAPIFYTNVVNGLPALRFEGLDQQYFTDVFDLFTQGPNMTFFTVFNHSPIGADYGPLWLTQKDIGVNGFLPR